MMNYIVGNWKSNKSLAEALAFLEELKDAEIQDPLLARSQETTRAIIAPPFPFLGEMKTKIKELELPIALAVQDLSGFGPGPYTGEIATESLVDLGVEYAILGHSETREYHRLGHDDIALKIEKAVAAGIKPILCLDSAYVTAQAKALDPAFYSQLIIAFEPLTSISNGKTLSSTMPVDQVEETFTQIRRDFSDHQFDSGDSSSESPQIPLLYGGSVSPATIHDYLSIGQGSLVGSASLQALSFHQLFAQSH